MNNFKAVRGSAWREVVKEAYLWLKTMSLIANGCTGCKLVAKYFIMDPNIVLYPAISFTLTRQIILFFQKKKSLKKFNIYIFS